MLKSTCYFLTLHFWHDRLRSYLFYVYYISKFWICQLILKIFLLYVRRCKLGKNRAGRRGFCRKRRSGGENELWFLRKSEWVIQSQLRRGRLCHTPKGGGCNEKKHIEGIYTNDNFFNCTYTKSKIAPTGQVGLSSK